MPIYAVVILLAAWIVWILPFLLQKKRAGAPTTLDRRARWGIVLQSIAYGLIWFGPFWLRPREEWRIALATVLLALGCTMCWAAVKALGRQWRIDAGLSDDHELVRAGPYRIVRHPIYASMLAMFLGTGFMIALWAAFAPALVLFVIGTEIRVRVEDSLLLSRFDDQARTFQREVPAYVPWLH